MKVALVYDWLNKWGGAERVLLALHKIWPSAPLYTSVYNPQSAAWAKDFQVVSSWLNSWPMAKKNHEFYPWLLPIAFESFDFSGFDLVISVTSSFAKGIIVRPGTRHLCYCLTPTRFLWSGFKDYFISQQKLARPIVDYLQKWDKVASQRPDAMIAISKNVQRRIKRYYQQDSKIIYPPINTNKWQLTQEKPGNYFLIVSRLVAYKKIDLVIRVFNQLGWSLKIVGVGSQLRKLKKLAKKNIQFLGQLTDQELLGYYQKCQAVIFPQEEDLGLVPLEAQSCGRPVIAYQAGGILETVIDTKTGLFFKRQTEASLLRALEKFSKKDFKPEACRQNALRFQQEKFEKEFRKLIC